jgi:hypothetical protein
MNPSAILPATFVLSITGLSAFIGSLRKGLFDTESTGARSIFSSGGTGRPEAPSAEAGRAVVIWACVGFCAWLAHRVFVSQRFDEAERPKTTAATPPL